MFTGPFSTPEVVAFPALPHLPPFIILMGNIHHHLTPQGNEERLKGRKIGRHEERWKERKI
jgi:hypothetical protein